MQLLILKQQSPIILWRKNNLFRIQNSEFLIKFIFEQGKIWDYLPNNNQVHY
jgi:hypothetical protein